MPEPRKDETESNFMGRCISQLVVEEKKERQQAIAICNSIWEESKK